MLDAKDVAIPSRHSAQSRASPTMHITIGGARLAKLTIVLGVQHGNSERRRTAVPTQDGRQSSYRATGSFAARKSVCRTADILSPVNGSYMNTNIRRSGALTWSPPTCQNQRIDMSHVTTKDGTQIFHKDRGQGEPIVFHHGWPLSADGWDAQMLFFIQHGSV